MSKGNMEIRKSTREDIKQIMAIFTTAKEYMAAHGNKTQWGDGYPGEEILKTDIDAGNSYVIVNNGMIVGTFSFIIGEEPTYQVIKNGKWTDGRLYGTIHRLASNGIVKGIARACFEYCIKQIDYMIRTKIIFLCRQQLSDLDFTNVEIYMLKVARNG